MTRKQVLELIKLAVAENDLQTATRLFVENRISRKAYNEAASKGYALQEKLQGRDISTTTFAEL